MKNQINKVISTIILPVFLASAADYSYAVELAMDARGQVQPVVSLERAEEAQQAPSVQPPASSFEAGPLSAVVAAAPKAARPLTRAQQIANFYVDYLGRKGSEKEILNWVKTPLKLEQIKQAFLQSQERANLVGSYYQGYLGRNGSAAEIKAWARQDIKVPDLKKGFLTSQERSNLVASYYQNYLGRAGSAAEIKAWALQDIKVPDLKKGFLQSQERSNLVASYYQNYLGRSGSAAEIKAWAYQDKKIQDIKTSILVSDERKTKIADYYVSFVGRTASEQEVLNYAKQDKKLTDIKEEILILGGWTRAASNSNYATRMYAGENSRPESSRTLQVIDLRTGEVFDRGSDWPRNAVIILEVDVLPDSIAGGPVVYIKRQETSGLYQTVTLVRVADGQSVSIPYGYLNPIKGSLETWNFDDDQTVFGFTSGEVMTVDLKTLTLVPPPLPAGWTRAASNADYAYFEESPVTTSLLTQGSYRIRNLVTGVEFGVVKSVSYSYGTSNQSRSSLGAPDVSSDGAYLVNAYTGWCTVSSSGCARKNYVEIYDTATRAVTRTIYVGAPHIDNVQSVSFEVKDAKPAIKVVYVSGETSYFDPANGEPIQPPAPAGWMASGSSSTQISGLEDGLARVSAAGEAVNSYVVWTPNPQPLANPMRWALIEVDVNLINSSQAGELQVTAFDYDQSDYIRSLSNSSDSRYFDVHLQQGRQWIKIPLKDGTQTLSSFGIGMPGSNAAASNIRRIDFLSAQYLDVLPAPEGWTLVPGQSSLAYRGDNASGVEVMNLVTGTVSTTPTSQNLVWSTGYRNGIRYVITPEGMKELYYINARSNTSLGTYDLSSNSWGPSSVYVPSFYPNANNPTPSPDGVYAVTVHQFNNITVSSLTGTLTSSRIVVPAAEGYGIPYVGQIVFTSDRTAIVAMADGSNRQFHLDIQSDGSLRLTPILSAGQFQAGGCAVADQSTSVSSTACVGLVGTSNGTVEIHTYNARENTGVTVYDSNQQQILSYGVASLSSAITGTSISADGKYLTVAGQLNRVSVLSLTAPASQQSVLIPQADGYGAPRVGEVKFINATRILATMADGSNRQFYADVQSDGSLTLMQVPISSQTLAAAPATVQAAKNVSTKPVLGQLRYEHRDALKREAVKSRLKKRAA